MNLPKIIPPLSQISIYETKGFLLLVGYSSTACVYSMLELTRPTLSVSSDALSFKPHPVTYTETQMKARLEQMKTVYKDLTLMYKDIECIYGIVKLLDSHYLIVVTKKRLVGSIVGHSIYTIESVQYIPVTYKLRVTAEEPRYKSLLTSFDLTKHIHFSYTYDLSRSWQQQVSQKDDISTSACTRIDTQNMFTWNSFALQPFLQFKKDDKNLDAWVMPVVYGYFRQKNMRFNDVLTLGFALIARRSRHFAGTRYLRRGSDCVGHVANEVETEQIFIRTTSSPGDCPRVSSVVQCRGSIPLYWSHTNLYNPKPDVQLEDSGLGSEQSAKIHFQKLFNRYGTGVHVVNLVKQTEPKPLEQIVGNAFRETVEVLNKQFVNELDVPAPPVTFIAYDFLNMAKKQHALEAAGGEIPPNSPNVFKDLNTMCEEMFPKIGFYVDPPSGVLSAPKVLSFPLEVLKECDGVSSELTHTRVTLAELDRQAFMLKKELKSLTKVTTDPEAEDDILLHSEETGVGKGTRTGLKQFGVMRTNCMDCLDRTNVAQFCFARVAIPRQVLALGIALNSQGIAAVISSCMEVWAEHGDTIATQYGGSGAMHKVDQQEDDEGENQFVLTGGAKNALVACQRFYSNISTDYERQQSMDLLLGIFEPKKDEPHIWEHKHRARHLRVGKLGRRSSDLMTAIPNVTVTEKANDDDANKVSENEMSRYISESRNMQTSVVAPSSSLNSRPGFRIEGLAGQFFHTASSIRISLTVFSDLVEESNIESVSMNKVPIYPFPPSSHLIYRDEVVRYTVNDSESGSEEGPRILSVGEQKYVEYIQGQLLFPSRVDLSDWNISSQKRDANLELTIRRLAGLEHVLNEQKSSDTQDVAEPKPRVSFGFSERVSMSDTQKSSRSVSIEPSVPNIDMKSGDYFSFQDIYSNVEGADESKSRTKSGETDVVSLRTESADSRKSDCTDPAKTIPQQQSQQPAVQPVVAPKRGFFGGLFGGKSKSNVVDEPPAAPPKATPFPSTLTVSTAETVSVTSNVSPTAGVKVSATASLPPPLSSPSSMRRPSVDSVMTAKAEQSSLNRVIHEAVQEELRKMNVGSKSQPKSDTESETIKALNIKIALLQKTVESLLDLKLADDCNM